MMEEERQRVVELQAVALSRTGDTSTDMDIPEETTELYDRTFNNSGSNSSEKNDVEASVD